MNYLQLKKRAFMKVVNSIKGVVRTASGIPPLMLEGCVDDDSMIGYTIYGNSIQDGTPTPDAPVEIESVGEYDEVSGKYKIPVVARGKNLIPNSYLFNSQVKNGVTFTVNNDGSILLDGTVTKAESFYLFRDYTGFIPNTKVGDRLTISKNVSDESKQASIYLALNYYDETGAQKAGIMASTTAQHSGEVKDTWKGMYVYINTPLGATYNNLLLKPMLEISSTATEYEPYVEPVTTNIYLAEPLRRIDEYRDNVEYDTKNHARYINKMICTGSENWRLTTSGSNDMFFIAMNDGMPIGYGNKNILCNMYPTYAGGWTNINAQNCIVSSSGSYMQPGFVFETGTYTIETWKQYVTNLYNKGTPLIIEYILSEPIEEPITLPLLPTIKGTTVYEIDTTIQPSQMGVTYYSNAKGD